MNIRLKISAALAVTVMVALDPSPALAAKGYLFKNDVKCLTYVVDHTPQKAGNRAWAGYCPSTDDDGYVWKRTARSQLAVTYRGRTLCLSAPKGTAVLVRRCGSDLKHQQFTFPVVTEQAWYKVVQIKWKGLPNTCLYLHIAYSQSSGEISAMPCERANSGQHWVMTPR